MKIGRRTLFIGALFLVGLILVLAALRRTPTVDGEPIGLATDAVRFSGRQDDLVLFGTSDISLLEGSEVDGDAAVVALTGSPIVIAGSVNGDLVALGSDIRVERTAEIAGNASLVGSDIELLGSVAGDLLVSGARVRIDTTSIAGTVDACEVDDLVINPDAEVTLAECPPVVPEQEVSPLAIAFSAFATMGVAALAVTIFPRQVSVMEDTLRRRPLRLVGTGLALVALFIGVGAALALVVTAIPDLALVALLAFALWLIALVVMALVGGIPIAVLVGDALLSRLGVQPPPLVAGAAGAVVLVVGSALLSAVPFLVWLVGIAQLGLFFLSLGIAYDTRLGLRSRARSILVQG